MLYFPLQTQNAIGVHPPPIDCCDTDPFYTGLPHCKMAKSQETENVTIAT
jgi:hypothetical protein